MTVKRKRFNVKNQMYLLIGNSRWHWAIKKGSSLTFKNTEPNPKEFKSINIDNLQWAAVGPLPKSLQLKANLEITSKDIPLLNTPPWIGVDRALAGWEAYKQAKALGLESTGLLVADAGTVFSMTKITGNGEFSGGQLLPGKKLQIQAMTTEAENLKKLKPRKIGKAIPLFPLDTIEAMERGAIQSLTGAIHEALLATKMPLWLCGGDAPQILKELEGRKLNIIYQPNLILNGMISLLN